MGKIFIGNFDKISLINKDKIYVVGDPLGIPGEHHITFKESIMYKHYFSWLAEIDKDTTLVLNNILKKRQRNCLEYNCIRYYCQQAGEVIVFNDFPLIESIEDFYILYDMVQINPFYKYPYKEYDDNIIESNATVIVNVKNTEFGEDIIKKYFELKEKTILQVKKDPDIIPRRLLKFAEKLKGGGYDKLTDLKPVMNVCVSNLKVDQYFYSELKRKEREINEFTNLFKKERP